LEIRFFVFDGAVVVTETVPTSTDLAVDRTRLAHERTLMAWVRTATSLITFGFTIYKFFQFLREKGEVHNHLLGPREFALLMIGIGLTALFLATVQQRREMKTLRRSYPTVPYSLATVLAALISILGILAFITVLLRH
jgi:putative membrane protein